MKKVILLDGPMGTEIDRRGGDTTLPLWSARALIESPELVKEIHKDYIKAGADVVTTNTFRTQEYTFEKAGITNKSKELTELAVNLIKELKANVKIAGSVAPIEECYSPHLTPPDTTLKREFELMTGQLVDGGVDIILIETMNSIREASVAYTCAREYDLPIWLSFTCNNSGDILSGESWQSVSKLFGEKVELISVNCSSIEATDLAISKILTTDIDVWGFYPNFGVVDDIVGWKTSDIPSSYLSNIERWLDLGSSMIGTCCGATPPETSKLRSMIESKF